LLAHGTRAPARAKELPPLPNKPGCQLWLFARAKFYLNNQFWAKTRAEHGTGGTEGKQALLSKNLKNQSI
jgi:hypothetical protein